MSFKTRWFENSALRTAVEGVAAMIASKTMGFEIELSNQLKTELENAMKKQSQTVRPDARKKNPATANHRVSSLAGMLNAAEIKSQFSPNPPEMAVENPDMRQLLAAQTEWHRAVAFDSQGAIIGATCQPSAAEITCVRDSVAVKFAEADCCDIPFLPPRLSSPALSSACMQLCVFYRSELAKSYDNRDATVGKGFTLCGDHFDVHRFHSELIYGRRGDSETGEGIAMCRVGGEFKCLVSVRIRLVIFVVSLFFAW